MGFYQFLEAFSSTFKQLSEKEIKQITSVVYESKLPLSISYEHDKRTVVLYYEKEKENYFKITPGVKDKTYSFIIKYPNKPLPENLQDQLHPKIPFAIWGNSLRNHYGIMKKGNIVEISKDFYKIYEDAVFLDKMGSVNAGILYRKALEFIILDYLIFLDPKYKPPVTTKQIRKDFGKKIQDKEIDAFVCNNFMIGNDFSHYRKVLNTQSLKELKQGLDNIVELIDTKVKQEKENHEIKAKMFSKDKI